MSSTDVVAQQFQAAKRLSAICAAKLWVD